MRDFNTQLTQLLELDWSLNNILFINEDSVKILTINICIAKSVNWSHFAYISPLKIVESETYAKAI